MKQRLAQVLLRDLVFRHNPIMILALPRSCYILVLKWRSEEVRSICSGEVVLLVLNSQSAIIRLARGSIACRIISTGFR